MKVFLQQVAGPIRGWGYRGSGQYFRRIDGDIIFVINFQKSRSGDRFFVNLGGQPTVIPDEGERDPNPRTLKEYECVFRRRLPGDWNMAVSPAEIIALIAALDEAREKFESKVKDMRGLSRRGQPRELFDGRQYMGTEPRAALLLARLLAADGHVDGARKLAERAIADAGEARLLRAAAQRLIASLQDR